MDQEKKYELIAAFLSGEANADKINNLRTWLAQSDENKKEFEELKAVWLNTRFEYDTENLDQLYARASEKLSSSSYNTTSDIQDAGKRRHLFNPRWVAAAAVILLMFSVALLIYQYQLPDNSKDVVVNEIVKENPAGVKKRIKLPDGSDVYLNSESKLTYNSDFGIQNRDITLTGEAFFDVAKDTSLPLRVRSHGKLIEAVGTAFDARAFVEDRHLKVFLVEGRVNIRNVEFLEDLSAGIMLNEGEQYQADLNSGETYIEDLDNEELLWRNGTIHFKSASMNEVFRTLERWYGVDFQVEGSMDSEWNYTGEFSNETLENVLSSISYSKQFDYETVNKKVIVKPKNN